MKKGEYTIQNEDGVDIRTAEKISDLASLFEADIFLRYKNDEINVKSIMGFVSLTLSKGAKITIEYDGFDEEEAFHKIEAFLFQHKLI